MNDTVTLRRNLEARGYKWEHGGSHWKITWQGRLVATASCSPRGGKRSLNNLRAQIRRFERSKP